MGTTIQNCIDLDPFNTTYLKKGLDKQCRSRQNGSHEPFCLDIHCLHEPYNLDIHCLFTHFAFPPSIGISSGSTLFAYSFCFFSQSHFSAFKDLSDIT